VAEKQEFIVGTLDEFPPGKPPRILEVGGRSIGVYNIDGTFYAVQNVCPHALGPICRGTFGGTFLPSEPGEWIAGLENRVIRCPRHRFEFDIATGESVMGAVKQKLVTFPVSIEGNEVRVTMRPRPSAIATVT
jgi:3-phenylpropionate/trans-cinnamate dioxygenase ferredoxin subunit